MPANAPRIRYHNRLKVLLCYVLAWGLALLVPYLALKYLYPYKLAGAAPDLRYALSGVALPQAARDALEASAIPAGAGRQALLTALNARDWVWRYAVGGVVAVAWLLSLVWQLGWRAAFMRPAEGARAALKAVRAYRWSLAGIVGLNLLGALLLYATGLQWVVGRTGWDYAVCFCGFAIIPLAAMACFRLAAPPAISGKRAFFRRL